MSDHPERYRVIGGCEIDGVPNGDEITHAQLEEAGANIWALVDGKHIEPLTTKPLTTQRRTKKDEGGDGDD